MSKYDTYTSPLAERNASKEMLALWSPRHKFNTWRKIWLAVAQAQHELGLPVTKEQVDELQAVVARGITDEEMQAAEKYERELRHDVMAHVHALGDSCPKAKGIIHLGMTSQDVVCNADLEILIEAQHLIELKLARVVISFADQARQWSSCPTLGFTHYQPAQPLTVGRRIAQWSSEVNLCYERAERGFMDLYGKRKGLRGATGTQASYLSLFNDSSFQVDMLEAWVVFSRTENFDPRDAFSAEAAKRVLGSDIAHMEFWTRVWSAESRSDATERHQADLARLKALSPEQVRTYFADKMRQAHTYSLVTQTYPRVIDTFILSDLASAASVLHKIATDIRLLCNRKEIDEPFESKQIGSSAMPYKRNPMRCERICGLTRFVMNLVGNAYDTAATQWLERTLDDSSNRRLSLP